MKLDAVLAAAVALGALVCAAPAWADPCEGHLPMRPGVGFAGIVRYVGDGDSLCIGKTADPKEWIEVRLFDFNAPELHDAGGPAAKAALERLALRRDATCTSERGHSGRVVSFDRVIARCELQSRSIGTLLRAAGVAEGGN
ncbi:nuclease [Bradyrhizobium viridifuturi]|nr:nuclease [Bradyrhizobium viridifuturi]MBR1044954.1 nuclease [Bradyrhizobium viridifuturi]MBR1084101.1 nuclease [Bradyrhizobium viridifuturi]MBR1096378.1 nuclease [Bradyrhizobium viridifuturi]MBR1103460.1 nuclease [Bradyrhizobium viridifuturi]